MKQSTTRSRLVIVLVTLTVLSCSNGGDGDDTRLSFFITSTGMGGGDLGGLIGADAHCQQLATAVGAGDRTWRAYLSQSATAGQEAINARDRIGSGPWFNANGELIAADIAELHGDNNLDKNTALTETGQTVNGRGDTPKQHDIFTGSTEAGMAFTDAEDHTCSNWTSNGTGAARVGHHDRPIGSNKPSTSSWNSAHDTQGCSMAALQENGGSGYFYCFAAD